MFLVYFEVVLDIQEEGKSNVFGPFGKGGILDLGDGLNVVNLFV